MNSLGKSKFLSLFITIAIITTTAFVWYLYKPSEAFADVAAVSGQNQGEHSESSSLGNLTFAGSVTSGNTIIVIVDLYLLNGAVLPSISTPTKSAGTATIGAFTLDKAATDLGSSNGSNISLGVNVYRASVTGTGTLTIAFSGTFSGGVAIINEYSGMAASPVDGTPVSNNAHSTTESTGNVVTSTCGMVIMSSLEISDVNPDYVQSDTNIYNQNDFHLTTAQAQHKITSSASTYNLTVGLAGNWVWLAAGVAYKATSCSGGGGGSSSNAAANVKIRGGGTGSIPTVKIRGGGTTNSSASYSTSFPATENPISEGGNWVGGSTAGGSLWGDVRTTPGFAFGASEPTQYGDPTALLTGSWDPNQSVTATVKINTPFAACCHEVEIRLLTTISASNITGYEILCSIATGDPYMQIVRWDGPNGLGNFTYIGTKDPGAGNACKDGDVLVGSVTVSGGTKTFSLTVNGTPVIFDANTDSGGASFSTGNPGIGFFDNASGGDLSSFGFSSMSATGLLGGSSNTAGNVKFR